MRVPNYRRVLEDAVRKADLRAGEVYRAVTLHDDLCTGFISGKFNLCDCAPTVEIRKVADAPVNSYLAN